MTSSDAHSVMNRLEIDTGLVSRDATPVGQIAAETYCEPQAGTSLSFAGSIALLFISETEIVTPLLCSTACCSKGMVSLRIE